MPKFRTVLLDCDSTLSEIEGIDELAVECREDVARLTTPSRIHWCTGSEAESHRLNEDLVAAGQFLRLNRDWPNCFLARSDPRDVARVEERTFICSATQDDAGPSNNWFSPMQMHDRLTGIPNRETLLAIGQREDHTVQVRVHPALIPLDAPLAKVDGVFNAVQVTGDLTGMVFLQGRGAGSMPTTSAVVADLLNVAHGIAQGAPERFVWREDPAAVIKPMDEVRTRYYLRLRVPDRAGVLAFYRITTIDLPVVTFAAISIGIQVLLSATTMLARGTFLVITSQVLHMMGAVTGFVVGAAMVRWKWVDCENWDVFSVWKGRHTMSRDQLAEEALNSEEGKRKLAAARETMHTQFQNYLKNDEPAAALAVHRRGKKQFADWRLPEPEHIQMIQELRKWQLWDDATLSMVEYLHLFTERAVLVRLALAQLLIEQLNRPRQGIKVLAKLDARQLPPPQQQKLTALKKRAEQEAEENPFEATVDDW